MFCDVQDASFLTYIAPNTKRTKIKCKNYWAQLVINSINIRTSYARLIKMVSENKKPVNKFFLLRDRAI